MVSSKETGRAFELVESMTDVEFDAERERFQATYDSTRESASLAIVTVVATAMDRNPIDLPPLESAIDTDALEQLVAVPSGVQGCASISFRYEGFEVTVAGEGQIEAVPIENT